MFPGGHAKERVAAPGQDDSGLFGDPAFVAWVAKSEVYHLQARALAKKQEGVISTLKAKQNWQEESVKWVKDPLSIFVYQHICILIY